MLLIFGGTTEGRIAAKTCDSAGKTYYYSTKTGLQQISMQNGIRINGAMTQEDMISFCRQHDICCIIDAAHPFAENLHNTIAEAQSECLHEGHKISVIRLQRSFPQKMDGVTYCKDYEEAVSFMKSNGVKRLLALSGANTISKLADFWHSNETIFRILPRTESIDLAKKQGFPISNIIYYNEETELPSLEDEKNLMKSVKPDAIITKESGESGGLQTKVEAAQQLGIAVYVIEHPKLPDSFITVSGEHTLRRAIEQTTPGFFPLRTGITTGACATAATKAALMALLSGEAQEEVSFALPDGEILTIPVHDTIIGEHYAESIIIKDAGDDPDVTNGCKVHSRIEPGKDGIRFLKGEGIGTVTLPGLGIEVGEPAINTTPRKMMTDEVRALSDKNYDITISVEGGEEIAKHTFNPKLGVVGGISIIGTSGIVHPLSNEAFIESIRREISVAKAIGAEEIIFVSGKKSEEYIKGIRTTNNKETILKSDSKTDTPTEKFRFIHYGNFIGQSICAAFEAGFRHITLGIMLGKAVKLAEGHLDTHSHKVTMNKTFLKQLALDAGCTSLACAAIDGITLARELWETLSPHDAPLFIEAIRNKCHAHCQPLMPEGKLDILIIRDQNK